MSSNTPTTKVAIVIDDSLPGGLAANTAAVLTLTVGRRVDRAYEDYGRLLEASTDTDIAYLGVALHGPAKQVQKLTGSLPVLR